MHTRFFLRFTNNNNKHTRYEENWRQILNCIQSLISVFVVIQFIIIIFVLSLLYSEKKYYLIIINMKINNKNFINIDSK